MGMGGDAGRKGKFRGHSEQPRQDIPAHACAHRQTHKVQSSQSMLAREGERQIYEFALEDLSGTPTLQCTSISRRAPLCNEDGPAWAAGLGPILILVVPRWLMSGAW